MKQFLKRQSNDGETKMIFRSAKSFQFTGWHMAAVIGLFFGTIISVNLALAWFASNSWSGLVVTNSYVESQKFNRVTAEKIRASQLGWTVETLYRNGQFSVELNDTAGHPIHNAIVAAQIGRTIHEKDDQTVTLEQTSNSNYSAAVRLAAGLWEADVSIIGPKGEVWTKAFRFVVKE